MHGMQVLPASLVNQLADRIVGATLGGVKLTPPVDETISDLARRTAAVGLRMLAAHGAEVTDENLSVPYEPAVAQPLQRFRLADFAQLWNPAWTLQRAGFGGGDGGMRGIRGQTHLEGDTLATYPRDEVRGLVLRRVVTPRGSTALTFRAGVDAGQAWQLQVYADNQRLLDRLIEGPADAKDRHWENIRIDLAALAGKPVTLRLFQRVLIAGKTAGNAYWKELDVK